MVKVVRVAIVGFFSLSASVIFCYEFRPPQGKHVQAPIAHPIESLEPKNLEPESGIRKINFEQFLIDSEGLQGLPAKFGEDPDKVSPIKGLNVEYADLTGDGEEEAVVEATTIAMGNGGADIVRIFTLDKKNVPAELKVDNSGFKGNLFEGQHHSTPRLGIKNGKLTCWYPMYGVNEKKPKAGWTRNIIYRWSGSQFVIDQVNDVPPSENK